MIDLHDITPLHSQDATPTEDVLVAGRLHCQAVRLTWLLFERAADGDQFAAYLITPEAEAFGYFSLAYLQAVLPTQAGLIFERSRGGPLTLREAVSAERRLRRVFFLEPPLEGFAARACYLVAEYPRPQATRVFHAIEKLLRENACELSAFQRSGVATTSQIVVIGDRPEEPLYHALLAALEGAALLTIPYEELLDLFARTRNENQKGPWRHMHRALTIKRTHP